MRSITRSSRDFGSRLTISDRSVCSIRAIRYESRYRCLDILTMSREVGRRYQLIPNFPATCYATYATAFRARSREYTSPRQQKRAEPRAVAIVPSSSRSELTLARLQLISIRSPSPSLVSSLFFSSPLSSSSQRSASRSCELDFSRLSLHLRRGDFSSVFSSF